MNENKTVYNVINEIVKFIDKNNVDENKSAQKGEK